ncbi:MAG: Peptidase putative rane-associated zinc metallopeptidase, partial [Proteobacteria bacterium]|nr:Peptidase putative rane-associated zinc metallopeptidase [Pseudomonadota bacterium]
MSSFFSTAVAFLVVLGALIIVHEWGHFIVARLCGVKVLRFSVGFGKPLLSRKFGRDKTEWALGAFPLGGYVKMLDEREDEVAPEELHRAFNRQSIAKRSAIVVAGPAANFLLAILVYWGIFWTGSEELMAFVGAPPAGSPAAVAGLVNGEQVRAVGGVKVETWQDFGWLVLQGAANQDSVELEVINEKNEIAFRRLPLAAVREQGWQGDGIARLGLTLYRKNLRPFLHKIMEGGVAEQAGLRVGDQILAVDNVPVMAVSEVVAKIRESADRSLVMTIRRGKTEFAINLKPEISGEQDEKIGRIGVGIAEGGEVVRSVVRYDFLAAGAKAWRETREKSVFTLVMMGKMLTGEVSWRNLSGPVTIADYAGRSARMGLDHYLRFLALVSISLGVLNLLPIPILDGGHLLYHVAEVIKRSPLSERVMELGQQIGMAILLVLMAFAFFNDINRLFSG